jgi:hypothetical protein
MARVPTCHTDARGSRKRGEDHVGILFVLLTKRETHTLEHVSPFASDARHMTYGRVSFHLASSNTISKFSPTSPTIPHVHQLLNLRCMTHLKISNSKRAPNGPSAPRITCSLTSVCGGVGGGGVGGSYGEDFVRYLFCTIN